MVSVETWGVAVFFKGTVSCYGDYLVALYVMVTMRLRYHATVFYKGTVFVKI